MPLEPNDIYLRLGHLATQMPDLGTSGVVTREVNEWLAQALALVELVAAPADVIIMKSAMNGLSGAMRQMNAQTITAIFLSALAKSELNASPEAQGKFIAASSPYQAFVAVGNVLRMAKSDVLIVDPYADSGALANFAIQAAEGVQIRLLADAAKKKPDLEPAIRAWRAQYRHARPLAVGLAHPKALHDRILIVDESDVWSMGQSLNGIGKNSPTAIVKVPSATAVDKRTAYEDIWSTADQI